MYADNFDLNKYIRFSTEVLMVKKSKDFSTEGRWQISSRDKKSGVERQEEFGAVLVCTGHHSDMYIPHFAGLDMFTGRVRVNLFISLCLSQV